MVRDLLASGGTALLLLSLVTLPFLIFTGVWQVSFANPAGFLGALLALPVLLLFMLKARRPQRLVGSLLFWQAIASEQQASSPFKRLRRNLVLLLLLLGLAASVYGLARPIVQGDRLEGRSLVIVLDVSASMGAEDQGEGTRFTAAQARAKALLEELGPKDQATLIAFHARAWTQVAWTQDRASLNAGLAALEPRHVGTRLSEALLLASGAVQTASGEAEVHLLSDGASPAPPPLELGAPLIYEPFGTERSNLGIVSVKVRSRTGGRESPLKSTGALAYQVFVTVQNSGPRARRIFVRLEREKRTLAARSVEVPGESVHALVLEARLEPGPLRVHLAPRRQGERLDAFSLDDTAHALVIEPRGVPVALISKEPRPALSRALSAAGGEVRRFAPGPLPSDPDLRLFVFVGEAPEPLPERDLLLIAPQRAIGPIRLGPPRASVKIGGQDRDDPLLRYVELSEVFVQEARPLLLGGGARALVQGEDAAGKSSVLIAAWRRGARRRVVLGFDPARSTLPLQPAFPIFVQNLVDASTARTYQASGGVRAGSALQLPASKEGESSVLDPGGTSYALSPREGQAAFAETERQGVYSLRQGERSEPFCVNLADAAESRIAPQKDLELSGIETASAPTTKRPQEVARWFALLALAVLGLEVLAYHRRW